MGLVIVILATSQTRLETWNCVKLGRLELGLNSSRVLPNYFLAHPGCCSYPAYSYRCCVKVSSSRADVVEAAYGAQPFQGLVSSATSGHPGKQNVNNPVRHAPERHRTDLPSKGAHGSSGSKSGSDDGSANKVSILQVRACVVGEV